MERFYQDSASATIQNDRYWYKAAALMGAWTGQLSRVQRTFSEKTKTDRF
jgi:hypothetical protein